MAEPTIRVEHLWKRYGLPLSAALRGIAKAILPGTRKPQPPVFALEDMSFTVERGETVGVIGRNGAGKSTLLKTLAGVCPPTHGRVTLDGSIFAMIELNAGIHPELSGRENIYLLGSVMGLNRAVMRERMGIIEEFCELGAWLEQPVRKYSSGMLARLGFSVAMNVDAKILLIDEVLAVGDLAFRQRCFDRIEALRKNDTTILFVSHNIRQVQRLCHRVLYLENGKLIADGTQKEVTHQYYRDTNEAALETARRGQDAVAMTMNGVTVSITAIDAQQQPCRSFRTSGPWGVEITLRAKETIGDAIVGFLISTTDFIPVFGTKYHLPATEWPVHSETTLRAQLPALPLLQGAYLLTVAIKTEQNRDIFRGEHLADFIVEGHDNAEDFDGLLFAEPAWTVQREGTA